LIFSLGNGKDPVVAEALAHNMRTRAAALVDEMKRAAAVDDVAGQSVAAEAPVAAEEEGDDEDAVVDDDDNDNEVETDEEEDKDEEDNAHHSDSVGSADQADSEQQLQPQPEPSGALKANLELFGGGGEAGSPRRKQKPVDVIKLVEDNDRSVTEVDFGGSTIFALKSLVLTEQLCDALKASTHVKVLDLTDCGLTDACAAMVGEMFSANTSITKCVLNKNKIKDEGCTALAHGLTHNTTLREIELFGQEGGRKWGEGCLVQWLEMYKTNVSIMRVNWCAFILSVCRCSSACTVVTLM
jgi:hypothetical protein